MLTLILVLTTVIFLYFYFKKTYSYWKDLGIPGPKAYPFIGTYFAENGQDGKEIESKLFKQYGSVFGTYLGTKPVFNTCEPEHIKQILGDPNTFQNFGVFYFIDKYVHKAIFFLNGEKWREGRKAISGHFTSRKLKSLINHFELVTDNFMKNIEFVRRTKNTDVINVKEMAKFYAVDMISKYIFAVDVDSFQQHQKESEFAKQAMKVGDINLFHLVLISILPLSVSKMIGLNIFKPEPLDKLGDLFKQMIKERDPTMRYEDLTELLQDAILDNKLNMTEDEVVGNCLNMFFAGTDTSNNAITTIFYYLIEYPEYKNKLYEELKKAFSDGITYEQLIEHEYLDAFISECLRLGSSLLSLDKVAAKDTILEKGNYKIKKGTVIWSVFYVNHINDEYFPDAKRFDPNRFLDKSPSNKNQINNGTYLPFSTGNRQCVGMRFALLEIKYLIVKVLLAYDLEKPANFKLEEISRRRISFPKHMHVCFRKRI